MDNERISWEEYALEIARAASLRSEDPFVKVGACALNKDHMVVGVGYNGLDSGKNLDWQNFSRDERRPLMIHAEANCLSLCRKNEVELLAVTLLPCSYCATLISAYNIKKVVYAEEYEQEDLELIEGIFEFNDIELVKLNFNSPEISCLEEKRKIELPSNDTFTIG